MRNGTHDLGNGWIANTYADPDTVTLVHKEKGVHVALDPDETARLRAIMADEDAEATQEDRIIDELLDRALGRGWGVSVYDGGGWPVRRSHDRAEIREAMKSTDADVLHFIGVDGAKMGWVMLIYGNGEDLISDSTYTGPMMGLCAQVNEAVL